MILLVLTLMLLAVTGFAVAAAQFFVGHPTFESYRQTIALGLCAAGGLFLLIGFVAGRRKSTRTPLAKLFDLRAWGFALGMMGGIAMWVRATSPVELLAQLKGDLVMPTVLARTTPESAGTNDTVATKEAAKSQPEPVLAGLKLQGIFYRQRKPAAMIDGELYEIGEQIAGFTVTEISPSRVTVERDSVVRFITLKTKGEVANRLKTGGT